MCLPSLVTVSPLLTVLGFLTGRATTVSTSDILFLLGLGFYLTFVLGLITATTEVNAVFEDMLEIVHVKQ